MNYRLVVEAEHDVGLDDPLDEGDLVQSYDVKIVTYGDEESAEVVAGTTSFDLVKLGAAIEHGVNAFEAMDTIDEELHEVGMAVLDRESGQLRQDVSDQVEYLGGDLMVLRAIAIEPEHRGVNLALVVADRLVDLYASGLVVSRAQADLARIGFELVKGDKFMVLGTTSERPRVSLVSATDN